ncbi:hypothetical protein SARC_05764, partial [Sphaeroforma arctica JP610]
MTRKRTDRNSTLKDRNACPVIVAESISDYRSCIASHVRPEDYVIEIGCASGVTTSRLANHCKLAVGIDKSKAQLKAARERASDVRFEDIAADDIPALLKLQ